uniref:Ribonuclease S-4 n=1 Tax=Cajanus cajan TaxID=3821 RepID=A0A151RN30_CAJCA|nr:Ribonuclease S-4 [Cajanus cajan]
MNTKNPCVVHISSRFTIHGLWPSNKSNSQPQFCPLVKIDANKIGPQLKSQLETNWPALKDERNISFWTYQWNKHDSCS